MSPGGVGPVLFHFGVPVQHAPVQGGQFTQLFGGIAPAIDPQPGDSGLFHIRHIGQHGQGMAVEYVHPAELVLLQRELFLLPVFQESLLFAVEAAGSFVQVPQETPFHTVFADHHFQGPFRQTLNGERALLHQGPHLLEGQFRRQGHPGKALFLPEQDALAVVGVHVIIQPQRQPQLLGHFHQPVVGDQEPVGLESRPLGQDVPEVLQLAFADDPAGCRHPLFPPGPGPAADGAVIFQSKERQGVAVPSHQQHIGSGFRKDAAELEKLLAFADDEAVLGELTAVKKANKEELADWLLRTQKVNVNPGAMFDIQSKRLHEYKRQQLNLLYLIHQYYEIKAGHLPAMPLVSIFGAKAAPAYTIAKDIIHALLTLSKVIAADPEVSKWLQVVFVENYNVTAAEKLIPACDLSEQISLASKEASGTGNMKFMLNGALTLGTMDGANVEISQQVGEENIYIFGQTSDQVIHRYAVGDYDPAQWVEGDANIRRAISFLTGPEMLAAGHAENLTRLHNELIHKDWFQTLPDFNAYVVRKGQALSDYACDPMGWRRKCLVNIAKAGMFSSDRTIAEYDRDIWHLGK